MRSGTIHIPRIKAFTSGTAASQCIRNWLFFLTPDAHLISSDAKDGDVRWDVVVADSKKGYWTTMAPLVVRNHVIIGVSGDFDNLSGFLKIHRSRDRQDAMAVGQHATRRNSEYTSGGMTWMTGTYDPDLNLIYWGTGNPTPVSEW